MPGFSAGQTNFGPPRKTKVRYTGSQIEVLDEDGAVTDTLLHPWSVDMCEEPRTQFVEEVHFDIAVVAYELIGVIANNTTQLCNLTPEAFEELIARLLSNDGWHVELTARTRDDNIDVIAIRRDFDLPASMIVQCKRYKESRKIGIDIVRSVMYTIDKYRTNFGMIATTSTFTSGAILEGRQMNPWRMEFRDLERIRDWCRKQTSGVKSAL